METEKNTQRERIRPDYSILPDIQNRPQFRERMIRDTFSFRAGGVSTSMSKKMTAQLLNFKPLTKLTSEEMDILKAYLLDEFNFEQETTLNATNRVLRRDGPSTLFHQLTDPVGWRLGVGTRDSRLSIWRSKPDLSTGVTEWFNETMRKKTSEGMVVMLDIGAAECQFAHSVRSRYGPKVEVHAATLENQPHEKVDFFHLICGEYMPETFRGKFDMITANGVLEFSVFPHLFIENVAKALAPSGEAGLTLNAHKIWGVELISNKGLSDRIQRYNGGKPIFERIRGGLEKVNKTTPLNVEIVYDSTGDEAVTIFIKRVGLKQLDATAD